MILALAGAVGLLGCEHSRPPSYPPDPLLLSKKPITSRSDPSPRAETAQHEPPAPESLFTTLASAGHEGSSATVPASLRREGDSAH